LLLVFIGIGCRKVGRESKPQDFVVSASPFQMIKGLPRARKPVSVLPIPFVLNPLYGGGVMGERLMPLSTACIPYLLGEGP
jgi:hypothetical protein